jgi:hypothetical protein
VNRRVPPQEAVAAFDSATALLAGLARALESRDFPALGQARWKVPLVRFSNLVPQPLRLRAYAVISGREGVPTDRLDQVDLDQTARWVADHYLQMPGRFPGVMIGSSNGALTHLAAACGVPWLPQTLLVPVRRSGADPEDLAAAAAFGRQHGPRLLAANPGVALHHMHDPEQDRLSSSQMAYFRVKWQRLPAAYARFLEERLADGAPVLVACDTSSWPVTRVGVRHVFQAGALGGLLPEDYLSRAGVPVADDEAAEAEWGLDESLMVAVRQWAAEHGHPVIEIRYHGPQSAAPAVADTFRAWLSARGLPANRRLLVSSFIVHDAWRTIATGSVPFWTFFPVQPAADALAAYLDRSDWEEIAVMLFSHGVRSPGLAPASEWQRLARRATSASGLLGVDTRRFPADFATFARYGTALARLPELPPPARPMSITDALTSLRAAGLSVSPEWLGQHPTPQSSN